MVIARPLLLAYPLVLILLAGCAAASRNEVYRRTPAGVITPEPTPAETVLLEQLRRDGFLKVQTLERDPDGHLEVSTQQGDGIVRRYVLAPSTSGGQDLVIRPVDEALVLRSPREAAKGTGPERRGLRR